MKKYSILIPLYNKELYIERAILSCLNQSYKDIEIIILNDGSTDNSYKNIEHLIKENNIKYFEIENKGIAHARNFLIEKVQTPYFLFLDADDYLENDAMFIIDNNMEDNLDILSFNLSMVDTLTFDKPEFKTKKGSEVFNLFLNTSKLFNTAVCYVYNTQFFKNNNFKYPEFTLYHEDAYLTPLVLLKSNKVKGIKNSLYFYDKVDNSITTTTNYENIKRKSYDVLNHFDSLIKTIKDYSLDKETLINYHNYIANELLKKYYDLNKEDKKVFLKEIKLRKIKKYISSNTLKRKTKKIIILINYKLYLKLFWRYL